MQTKALLSPVSTPNFRHRYHAEAYAVAGQMVLALRQRNLPPIFSQFILTETRQNLVWLIGVLDKHRLGKLDPYGSEATLHQISTLAGGKPTIWSNTTGVRYAVLLSGKPELPAMSPFPEPAAFPEDALPLGLTHHGSLRVSWQKLRNTLLTGTQGAGKSSFLTGTANVALLQGCEVFLADPEQHTFNPDRWNALTGTPVASNERDLLVMLRHLVAELERRSKCYRGLSQGSRPPGNLPAYNQLAKAEGNTTLPRWVLLIDEANDFFEDKALVTRLTELARHGRKWGLNLVLAAHNWRARDVPRSLSGRFPTRIAFQVDDRTSAAVVLEDAKLGKRAMELRYPGRGLIKLEGQEVQLFQAHYLSEAEEDRWQRSLASRPQITFGQKPSYPVPLTPETKKVLKYLDQFQRGQISMRQIEQQVFGYTGGKAHEIVKTVLEQHKKGATTTTNTPHLTLPHTLERESAS